MYRDGACSNDWCMYHDLVCCCPCSNGIVIVRLLSHFLIASICSNCQNTAARCSLEIVCWSPWTVVAWDLSSPEVIYLCFVVVQSHFVCMFLLVELCYLFISVSFLIWVNLSVFVKVGWRWEHCRHIPYIELEHYPDDVSWISMSVSVVFF